MECSISNRQDDFPITEGLLAVLTKVLQEAAEEEGIGPAVEVSLTLTDEEAIQKLNRQYRGVDMPTDVLAFALGETNPEEPAYVDPLEIRLLGDIIISVPAAVRQAAAYGHSLERELAFLALHGFLHLLGYDHSSKNAAEEMEQCQENILSRLDLKR